MTATCKETLQLITKFISELESARAAGALLDRPRDLSNISDWEELEQFLENTQGYKKRIQIMERMITILPEIIPYTTDCLTLLDMRRRAQGYTHLVSQIDIQLGQRIERLSHWRLSGPIYQRLPGQLKHLMHVLGERATALLAQALPDISNCKDLLLMLDFFPLYSPPSKLISANAAQALSQVDDLPFLARLHVQFDNEQYIENQQTTIIESRIDEILNGLLSDNKDDWCALLKLARILNIPKGPKAVDRLWKIMNAMIDNLPVEEEPPEWFKEFLTNTDIPCPLAGTVENKARAIRDKHAVSIAFSTP